MCNVEMHLVAQARPSLIQERIRQKRDEKPASSVKLSPTESWGRMAGREIIDRV